MSFDNPGVIIIGGGVAGFGAALELSDLARADGKPQPKIHILEALNRLGGRMKSAIHAGRVTDMGGSWMHGGLANVFHHWAYARYGGQYVYSIDKIKDPIILTDRGTFNQTFTAAQFERFENLWLAHQAEHPGQDASFTQLLARVPVDQQTDDDRDYLRMSSRLWMAAKGPSEVSAREFFDDPYSSGGVMIRGGMSVIIKLMADEARARGARIENGAQVKSVEQSLTGTDVTLADGRVMHAERCIVTVPLEVLKKGDLSFNSDTPPELAVAMTGTNPALFAKVVMPVNPNYLNTLRLAPEQRISDLRNNDEKTILFRSNNSATIIKMMGGEAAKTVETQNLKTVQYTMIAELQSTGYFPHLSTRALDGPVQVTDWNTNPLFGQAYSVKVPGYNRDGVVQFGRIGVAGEAFSLSQDGGAQISGAHQSGVRLVRKMYQPS